MQKLHMQTQIEFGSQKRAKGHYFMKQYRGVKERLPWSKEKNTD